jgi:hypothetical protein
MGNPFKKIIENQQVPEILREKVLNDIRLIKLTLDVADLISIKYPSSVIDLLNSTTNKKKKKNR